VIYVSGRDGITRFHDFNKDGSADYYENFNNEVMSTEGFHEFVFDLQTDAAGNFYFAKANPVNGGGRGFGNQKASRGNGTVCSHAGALFKVSPDGKKFEVVARGLRAPNGIGVRADGQVTTSDNEGTWVPTTPINWVDDGKDLPRRRQPVDPEGTRRGVHPAPDVAFA
jgi:glucose/arabinose dehydrogenase